VLHKTNVYAEPGQAEAGARTRSLTGRILVVDDNDANRDMLCRRLARQGHETTIAENGRVALNLLGNEQFDLVLLDVMMPEMDGYEVLKRMKADRNLSDIPVIMVSAQTELDSVVKCIELGAEDYLPKPFNPTLLRARVGASLEKKRLREQEQQHREQALRAEATLERHRSLAQMVAGVAHEINTPLGIASTALSIIENRLSTPRIKAVFGGDEHGRELLADILDAAVLLKNNVLRAHKLVETFKKISVSQITHNKETVDLPAVLVDAVELFKINARQAKLAIAIDTSGVTGKTQWVGYPGYLTQVMMNFLQNVERYAYHEGQGGQVDIMLTDEHSDGDGWFTVVVRDYGQGISPESLSRVFEPFFTTGRGKGGTGLGLAIVNSIVTSILKGTVTVSSERGKGTSFSVSFPKTIPDEGSLGGGKLSP
jgi:signal transduction histidine kinase